MEPILINNHFLAKNYLVCKAEPKHYDSLIALFLETASWLRSKGLSQWRHFLDGYGRDDVNNSIKNETAYIFLKDDVLVGTVTISPSPDEWDQHIWQQTNLSESVFIHRLAVKRAFSGEGLGTEILRWIEKDLTFTANKKYIKLDCVASNEKLNDFYVHNGYVYLGSSQDGHSKYQKHI